MRSCSLIVLGLLCAFAPAGFAQMPEAAEPPAVNGEDDKKKKDDKPSKTLFQWAIGPQDEKADAGEEEPDTIVTDRPDFTEASSTVGRGRIQLEAGYTFFRDRSGNTRFTAHSYPEMLWRIGMFADWFELRIGQNFATEQVAQLGESGSITGADDLYLGCKIGLVEQNGWLPEMGMILQMTVPSGLREFSAREVLPGINLLYSWDVLPDCISIGGSTQANRARSTFEIPVAPDFVDVATVGHSYLEVATSLTVGYTLTKKFAAYTEWFALFPHSSIDPGVGPEYYFNGGFTYLVTDNFQLDIRAGLGLNDHATDFFTGTGFAVRY